MAAPRRFDLDDIVNRAGTYFNPHTEVMMVVDDTTDPSTPRSSRTAETSGNWVLLGDEVPVDEQASGEGLVERFEVSHHPGRLRCGGRGRGRP